MNSCRIDTDLLIIGSGSIVKNGSIIIEGEKILYAGEQEHAPESSNTTHVPVIMPGLWDCHCHYWGIQKAAVEETLYTNPLISVLRSTWDVKETLMSGITSVREVGGFGVYLNKVIQEGSILGPRIYGAGAALSITGGHGDIHNAALDIIASLHGDYSELVDGVDACLQGVRKQLRKGAEIIKVLASGGVMSQIDHPVHQQFSLLELKTVVEEAARADVSVAAHCHGASGIRTAFEAGVLTIVDGTYLVEDLADLMLEKGAILVPTRYVVEKLLSSAKILGIPEYALEKVQAIGERHLEAIRIAVRKGVPIAMGTDMFTSGPNQAFKWGENAQELEYLVNAGMKKENAIITATVNGPKTLGLRAPKSGLLKEGYDADLLLLKKNPLDDISILYKKENIVQVIKQGKEMLYLSNKLIHK